MIIWMFFIVALQNLSLGRSNTFMQLIIKYKDQILSDFQYDMFKNPEKLVESVQRLYWKKNIYYT